MNTLDILAAPENLPKVLDFINTRLALESCESRLKTQIDVAVEEVFINISSYAYHPEKGAVQIQLEIEEKPPTAVIRFSDGGIPFNPLKKPDPNLKVPLPKRKRGGLGIYTKLKLKY